ncbi:MAG: ABC transporter permease [Pseudomonadota bacterium]
MKHPYLELILYKTYAELKAETRRTYLGVLWWVFEPIMYMAVFYVVFSGLMSRGGEGFVPFLLVGLVVWQWLKGCMTHGATTIMFGRALMQRVHLPKAIFPIVQIMTDTVKFFFIFALLLIFLWFSGYPPSWTYLALPLLLLVELILIGALTMTLAAIVPFMPDIRFIVDNLLLAVFFLSGIFFSADTLLEEHKALFYLNPMANLIEDYRNVLIYNTWPDWDSLGLIALLSIFGMIAAMLFINRFEYIYPKINT